VTWEPELEELAHRKALAAELGGQGRVARQRATGRRTVRERLDDLLDDGSFAEVGSVAGTATYEGGALTSFLPAGVVAGAGRIGGRRVVATGDDFTIKGGAANLLLVAKQVDVERRARAERVPVVRLLDGTGVAAPSSRSRTSAAPTCRSTPAGTTWSHCCRRCPWSLRRWARSPGSAPCGWSPATSA
jgi:acetyl-CoA carboxylase carboxyltransferase component